MTKKEAIEESIIHWEENLMAICLAYSYHKIFKEDFTFFTNMLENFGYTSSSPECALCRKYIWQQCEECPIYFHSGYRGCRNTPYHKTPSPNCFISNLTKKDIISVSNELEYLKSLPSINNAE